MASLKDLRNRIASVKATQKITKAMQMVAAAKLRRAQRRPRRRVPTRSAWPRCSANLAGGVSPAAGASALLAAPARTRRTPRRLTAERGLCGAFNSSIARLARDHAAPPDGRRQDGQDPVRRQEGLRPLRRQSGAQIIERDRLGRQAARLRRTPSRSPTRCWRCSRPASSTSRRCSSREFKSVIAQKPTAQQLIPAKLIEAAPAGGGSGDAVYEYEPDENEILGELLPRNIAAQIFRGLLENAASEQGARMSAMDNATRNAGDMINKLTLRYNRPRQAKITKELIEIISGAEAL